MTQPYIFPNIVPTEREYIPSSYSITQSRAQDGAIIQRVWASQPAGGTLRLTFTNVSDADAYTLSRAWDATKGISLGVILPDQYFEGLKPALKAKLDLSGTPLKWSLTGPPSINSVIPGVSTVQMEFRARGYGSAYIPTVTGTKPPTNWEFDPLYIPIIQPSFRLLRPDPYPFTHYYLHFTTLSRIDNGFNTNMNLPDLVKYKLYCGDGSQGVDVLYAVPMKEYENPFNWNVPGLFAPPHPDEYYDSDVNGSYITTATGFGVGNTDEGAPARREYLSTALGSETYFRQRSDFITNKYGTGNFALPVSDHATIVVVYTNYSYSGYTKLKTGARKNWVISVNTDIWDTGHPYTMTYKEMFTNAVAVDDVIVNCFLVTNSSIREIAAPGPLRERIKDLRDFNTVTDTGRGWDYTNLELSDIIQPGTGLHQTNAGTIAYIETTDRFLPRFSASPATSYGLSDAYAPATGVNTVLDAEGNPGDSSYYYTNLTFTPAIYSLLEWLYTDKPPSDTAAVDVYLDPYYWRDLINSTVGEIDYQLFYYKYARPPLQFARHIGQLPDSLMNVVIPTDTPSVRLIPRTFTPIDYYAPGEPTPLSGWETVSFGAEEEGYRYNAIYHYQGVTTGWSNPAYCRQKLIELGFTEADLTP